MINLRLHHVSMPVNNLPESVVFYKDVLNFIEIPRPTDLHGDGRWLSNNNTEIHLIEDKIHQGMGFGDGKLPDKKHFAFHVNDINEFRSYLIKNDVPVTELVEFDNGFKQFHFLDPSKNPIEITDYSR